MKVYAVTVHECWCEDSTETLIDIFYNKDDARKCMNDYFERTISEKCMHDYLEQTFSEYINGNIDDGFYKLDAKDEEGNNIWLLRRDEDIIYLEDMEDGWSVAHIVLAVEEKEIK